MQQSLRRQPDWCQVDQDAADPSSGFYQDAKILKIGEGKSELRRMLIA